jgi:hypothetical protein
MPGPSDGNVINLFKLPQTPVALSSEEARTQCQTMWAEARSRYLEAMELTMGLRLRQMVVGDHRTITTGIVAGTARQARETAEMLLEVADKLDAIYGLMRRT